MHSVEIVANDVVFRQDDAAIRSSAQADATARRLFGLANAPSGLLPPAVRWVGPRGRHWLLELPGQRLLVRAGDAEYSVLLPFTLLLADFKSGAVRCWCRPRQLWSLDDDVFHLPLPALGPDAVAPLTVSALHSVDEALNQLVASVADAGWGVPLGSDGYRRDCLPSDFEGLDGTDVLWAWSGMDAVQLRDVSWRRAGVLSELVARGTEVTAPRSTYDLFHQAARW
jgi:hypothetical protein